ncbi:MAG TPA: CHRD domain-containing protein [Nitrososphaeraceae archaeon]|nr:CHRD domain-containing protein [Nitrososphaeraceae archaeon]
MQIGSSKDNSEDVRFAAILTGKEQVPIIDTYDTGLAVFQPKDTNNNDPKFSIKIAGMDKIKKACLHIGKPHEDGEVVAELYKTETPQGKEVIGELCHGKLNLYDLRGPLQGKNINDLVTKMEREEAYVNILTEDNPKGKIRGQITNLA